MKSVLTGICPVTNMDTTFVFPKIVILTCLFCISGVAAAGKVKITRAVALTSSDIEIAWRPARGVQLKCDPRKVRYIVRYKTKGDKFQYAAVTKPFYTIENLEPDTRYKMAVRAVICKKAHDWSGFVEVKTMITANITSDVDNNLVKANILSPTLVNISWSLGREDSATKNNIKGYRLSLKKKYNQKKTHKLVKDTYYIWRGLQPETRYSLSVFILKQEGGKQKVSTVKFETPAAKGISNEDFRIVSSSDKSMTVTWNPVTPDSESVSIILQYKVRNADPPELCQLKLEGNVTSHRITGLRPNSLYAARIGIKGGNTTEKKYGGWERKLTTVDSGTATADQLADVYTISPSEAVIFWNNLTEKTYITEVSGLRFVPQVVLNNRQHYFLDNLKPGVFFNVTIKQFKDNCPYYTYAYIKTNPWGLDLASMAQTYWQMDTSNISLIENYTASLRVIEISDKANVFLWNAFPSIKNAFIILSIFEGTFLTDFRLNFIMKVNTSAIIIDTLNKTKDYRAILRMYSTSVRNIIYISSWLYIRATKTAHDSGSVKHDTFSNGGLNFVSPTSTDLFYRCTDKSANYCNNWNETSFSEYIEKLNIENLENRNMSIYSMKSLHILLKDNLTDSNTFGQHMEMELKPPTPPLIFPINDVTVTEGVLSIMKACHVQADPYPYIAWKNISNGELLNDSSLGVQISDISNVGSLQPVNDSVYMASERRIDISPVTIYVSGVYACIAENIAGDEIAMFTIAVKAKQPGSVSNLQGFAMSPYVVHVDWDPPKQRSSKPLMYRLVIMDEFENPLLETDLSNRTYERDELQPATKYKFSVAAFHEDGIGPRKFVTVKTYAKPILGRPENVSVTTINSTMIIVEWDPPKEVTTQFLFIRSYDVYYKRLGGTVNAEGSWGHKTTNALLTGLEENQLYEIRVVAQTMDAQVSQSKVVEGSTNRDAYMDESRPPPPPLNVYLRSEGGNIIVTWLPPYPTENILVRNYAIEVYNNRTVRQKMLVGYKESSVIIYEAEMGVLYRVSVAAKNNAGQSINEWAEIFIPQEHVTDYPVENFRGEGLSSTKLELFWDPPTEGSYNHYVISYTIKGDKHRHLPGEGTIPSNVDSYIVRSLKPFTEYEFTIIPYLNERRGVPANITVNTLSDIPGQPPTNISIEVINSTTVSLTADPPLLEKNGIIEKYKTAFRTKHKRRSTSMAPADTDETVDWLITNLDPSTTYEFRVRAYTEKGPGPWSDWTSVKTPDPDPVLPEPPANLTHISSLSSITIFWDPPLQSLKFIEGFIVGYGQFLPEVYRITIYNQDNAYTIMGLESGSTYIVSVRSFNQYGESIAVFSVARTKTTDDYLS